MRRFIFVLILLMTPAVPAVAQTPEDVVRWIYLSLQRPPPAEQNGLYFLSVPPQRSQFFTDRMVAFYEANDSYGDNLAEACVDFAFDIPGQDFDAAEIARTLQVSSQSSAQRIAVTADFITFGQPARVVYEFAQQDGVWKIDDIAGVNFRVSAIPCTPKAQAPARNAQAGGGYCYQRDADGLKIELAGDGRARIEFISWQANGHSCSGMMEGRQEANALQFHAEEGCLLQLRVDNDGSIVFSDADYTCKRFMCGQRAVLDGLRFPQSSQIECARWQGLGN